MQKSNFFFTNKALCKEQALLLFALCFHNDALKSCKPKPVSKMVLAPYGTIDTSLVLLHGNNFLHMP